MNIIESAAFHRLDGCLHVVKSGNHNDLYIFILFLKVFQNGESVNIRQADIQDNHIGRFLNILIQTFRPRQRRADVISFLRQIEIQGLGNGSIVVNDKNTRHNTVTLFVIGRRRKSLIQP
jgi:hypothetical protein